MLYNILFSILVMLSTFQPALSSKFSPRRGTLKSSLISVPGNGTFLPPPGVCKDLVGHLTQCKSILSQLNSAGLVAFRDAAINEMVAFQRTNYVWVSLC